MVFSKRNSAQTDPPTENVQPGYSVASDLYSTAANLGGIGLEVLNSAFRHMDTAHVPHNWKQNNGLSTNEKVVEWTHKKIGAKPRLIRVKGIADHMSFVEVDNRRDNMNDGDVFILDTSEIIYQWYGKDSNAEERNAANNFVKKLIRSRGPTTQGIILEQEGNKDDCPGFWKKIRAHPGTLRDFSLNELAHLSFIRGYHVQKSVEAGLDESVPVFRKKLYPMVLGKDGKVYREGEHAATRFFENHGLKQKLRVQSSLEEHDNKFDRALLESSKAYLLDDGKTLWVWIGLYTHIKEEDALEKATHYLESKNHHFLHRSHDRPLSLPVLLIREGKEPKEFRENFYSVNRDSSEAAYYQDDII